MKTPLYSSDLDLFEVDLIPIYKNVLKGFKDAITEPITQEKVEQARIDEQWMVKGFMKHLIHGKIPKLASVKDITLKNDALSIPIRIYTPKSTEAMPIIMFYHGGGYVVGSVTQMDPLCRKMAHQLGAMIVSVDYRLAPENLFPAAIDDCYFATIWVNDHISELGNVTDGLYVMGDSAGGGLAAAVTNRNAERKDFPQSGQILIYPWVSAIYEDPSFEYFEQGYALSKKSMEIYRKCYYPEQEKWHHPEFSPLLKKGLQGLPPTFLVTASHDPLRDQGNQYAKRIQESGVKLIYKHYLKTIHGFLSVYGILPHGKKIYQDFIQTARKFIRNE